MNRSLLVSINAAVGAGLLVFTLAQSQAGTPVFRAVKLPGDNERVTGIYCSSAKACVVATDVAGGAGHVYATDGQKITGTLVTGDAPFAEKLGTLGEVGFLGFSRVGNRLIAQVGGAGASFVSASGDFTKAASWSAVRVGTLGADETFGLNQQMGIGTKDGRWVQLHFRNVYESTDAPGPGALWTPIWSPVSPSIPSNFETLHRADPKLCDSDPGVSISPRLTQPAYVAPDLSVVLYPSGARNQRGSGGPGVCVSTDGARRFYRVEFKGIDGDLGPLGVTCVSSNHCLAYGGVSFTPESSFIFVTNDALKGVNSTWTRAKLPTLRENSLFRSVFFAPDGVRGWAVGASDGSSPMLLETADGGATWKDTTASIRALASSARLHSGFALDATHVWIGGEKSTLLTTGN